jgi:hypothetical protein
MLEKYQSLVIGIVRGTEKDRARLSKRIYIVDPIITSENMKILRIDEKECNSHHSSSKQNIRLTNHVFRSARHGRSIIWTAKNERLIDKRIRYLTDILIVM